MDSCYNEMTVDLGQIWLEVHIYITESNIRLTDSFLKAFLLSLFYLRRILPAALPWRWFVSIWEILKARRMLYLLIKILCSGLKRGIR